MADSNKNYHIWLHNVNGGSATKRSATNLQESAQKQKKFTPQDPIEEDEESMSFSNVIRVASSFNNLSKAASSAVSSIGAVSPYVAAAIVAIKLAVDTTDKVITTLTPFYTSNTGDYSFQIDYSNFKNALNVINKPISATISYFQQQNNVAVNNRRTSQERLLYGDTDLNYYTGV